MYRRTHASNNGIKQGYWSPEKKEDLVQALAAYEETGLRPAQIMELDKAYLEKCQEVNELRKLVEWIPAETPPKDDGYVLLSFTNFDIPLVGRYEADEEGGAYYAGDDADACISQDLIVNAWMTLPDPYRPEVGSDD